MWRSGSLAIDVPDGWSPSDDGEVVEIAAPGGGAAHVSAYRRTEPADATAEEVEAALERFLADRERRDVERTAAGSDAHGFSASARFVTDEDGRPHRWLAVVRHGRTRALLCTFVEPADAADDGDRRAAQAMFASIACD